MAGDFFLNLNWLPKPPEDFRQNLKEAQGDEAALIRLSTTALNLNQLNALAKRVVAARADVGFRKLTPVRLGVIGFGTNDFLAAALTATGLRFGLDVEVQIAPFNQMAQVCAGIAPAFEGFDPDIILLAPDQRGLPGDSAAALDEIDRMRAGIRQQWNVPVIYQGLAQFPQSLFGNHDVFLPGTDRQFCNAVNAGLASRVADTDDLFLDTATIAANTGLAIWHDPVMYGHAKLPFSQDVVPLYADNLCRLLAAFRGKSRRCLVLDLDNTLWGGVIGDDGLGGIQLGQGDAAGEAFIDIQKAALALRDRGIVLAVCSKNDDAVARLPFRDHPDMLLREEHIAVFQANWDDKASNIKAIADALNLGLESLVFFDDNPMERDIVRSHLPQVAVPELPEEPALFVRCLLNAGYFEALFLSDADKLRVADYQANARRVEIKEQAADLDSYLQTLNMSADLRAFDEAGMQRITQLINKSNQFNLTTRRYSEPEVRGFADSDEYSTWQVRLSDAFGDNGMISVVICRKLGAVWEVDTWLMSCRVLGRRVEELVLSCLVDAAAAAGAETLRGVYIPTDRNGLVKDHYRKLGFSPVSEAEDESVWELSLTDYSQSDDLPFTMQVVE